MNTKFTEAADQDILTRYEFGFDQLKKGFDQIDGLIDLISVFLGHCSDNIVFSEGHRSKIQKNRGGLKAGAFKIRPNLLFSK